MFTWLTTLPGSSVAVWTGAATAVHDAGTRGWIRGLRGNGSGPGAVAADMSAAAPGPAATPCSALPGPAGDVVAASPAGPTIGAGSSGVAGASARPYATAAARHLARGAKTPRGRGRR